MRLTVIEYASVDGVIQAPGHADEDRDGRQRLSSSCAFAFSDCRTILPRAGSPLAKACASFLAWSNSMWGGSGGTSGSTIAS